MDFSITSEQESLKKRIRQFAESQLNADIIERDTKQQFDRELWKKCAEFGILGLALPEEYGGFGLDVFSAMLAMEGFGYGCRDMGLSLSLNAQMWTVQQSILDFGSDEQKITYLKKMSSGEIVGCQAITEPNAGSDSNSMTTTAIKKGNGYVINGSKVMISNAPISDVALVFATVNPKLGKWGITAFMIDTKSSGFTIGAARDKMGLRTSPLCDLYFDDCFVPESARLGPEGAGMGIFNSALEWERSCMLASILGAMDFQLQQVIEYAKTRKQFGKSIGKFQTIANRVAEMKVRLETSRLLLYKVAWLKSVGKSALMEAAMLKLYLNECYLESSIDAIRIHGGYGYMSEFEVERQLRDAMGGTLYGGTSDIQQNIIARLLGL